MNYDDIVFDEWIGLPRNGIDFWSYQTLYCDALKKAGLSLPKTARSRRGFERFMVYALKRGHSNHPHNVRWKPIHEAHTAALVAEKLSRSV